MKRIHLGELEELILLMVAILNGEAYGVRVMEELGEKANRSVNISAIHASLRRLQEKGFVESQWSEASAQRGGRRKRLFTITAAGMRALEQVRSTRDNLWGMMPGTSPQLSFS